MSKPNKDGWIRHRGGKCPVYDGVLVEVRNRAGDIALKDGDSCTSVSWHWSHDKHPGDIMAYRVCEPVVGSVSIEQIEVGIDAANAGKLDPIDDVKAAYAGPLQWRDRITEIYRTVEALEEERVALVQRLEAEGFRLIGRAVQPVEDMSDWRNWKAGDLLTIVGRVTDTDFTEGKQYEFLYINEWDEVVVIDDSGDENGYGVNLGIFKFHSRPSK